MQSKQNSSGKKRSIQEIIKICEQAIALLPQSKLLRISAFLYKRLGAAYGKLSHTEAGNLNTALDKLKTALEISISVRDNPLSSQILNNIGIIYEELEDMINAENAYKLSLELHKNTDNRIKMAETLSNLGVLNTILNNTKQAQLYFLYSCNIFKQEDRFDRVAATWVQLGILHLEQKSDLISLRYLRLANDVYRSKHYDQAFADQIIICLYSLGEIAISRGNIQDAENYAQTAHNIFKPLEQELGPAYEARICCVLAQVFASKGHFDEAENIITPFITLYAPHQFEKADLAFIYHAFAIAISQKDKTRAKSYLFNAKEIASEQHIKWLTERISHTRDAIMHK